MKIPFDLDSWLADKSQKIVTRDGKPVRIICTDAKGSMRTDDVIALIGGELGSENIYRYYSNGTLISKAHPKIASKYDLFLVTDEPELTEFEQRIEMHLAYAERGMHDSNDIQDIKDTAKELLDLARKQLKAEGWEYTDPLFKECLADNSKTLQESSTQAEPSDESEHFDDLFDDYYDKNWEDGMSLEQCAKHFYYLGKVEALKNLPKNDENIKANNNEKD